MPKLVLIGGAPGVGKTTVLGHLPRFFERCAWLDADDVWRVHPPAHPPELRDLIEGNVIAVLRGYLEAGYPYVFLSWVLADPGKIERILEGLQGGFDSLLVVHLTASREALAPRSSEKIERGLPPDYQRLKATQIDELPFAKIDTSRLDPEGVALEIHRLAADGSEEEGTTFPA